MWKLIKGIPRAVRGQWIAGPQSACREDDTDVHRGNVVLGQRRHSVCSVRAAPVCTQANPSFHEAKSHRVPPRRAPPENPDPRGNEREEQQAPPEDHAEGRGPERDQWFQEWLRCFRHDCSSIFSQQHSVLEAVGWGSALLLGTQFAHHRSRLHSYHHGEPSETTCCPIQSLVRYALAMPTQQGILGAAKSILPKKQAAENSQPQRESDGLLEQSLEEADIELLHTEILLDQAATTCTAARSRKLDEEEILIPESQGAFTEAEDEWNKLTNIYLNATHNALGFKHAVDGQFRKAVPLWQKASDSGYAKAHFNLGLCFELGKGVEKDMGRAAEYYRLAATDGHPKGLYNLGVLYLQGGGGLKKDPKHALDLLESAAMQGLRRAQTELGVLYTEEERLDMKKAASLFQMASTQEDATGQYYMGICHENGWGVERNECKAADLYRKASEGGHATAAYNLAVFFENGIGGLPTDLDSARDMYVTSARLGNTEAATEAARLGRHIEEEEDSEEEHFQLQIKPRKSTLSGGLSGSASSPTLSDYICKNLMDFGFGELDASQAVYNDPGPKKPPQKKLEVSTKVKFYIGEDDWEPEEVGTKPGNDADDWLLGGNFGDSGYSSINGSSRSCSLNELSQVRSVQLVSCT